MPSQDMVLGCYYLTVNNISGLLGSSHYFASLEDVMLAYSQNKIELHSSIWIRINDDTQSNSELLKRIKLNDKTMIEYYDNMQVRKTENNEILVKYLKTTTGRVILNYTIQKTLNFL
jgi:DNA-directed RNA polymerase subunit beta'